MKAYYLVALYIPFVAMGMRLLRNALQNLFSMQIHKGLVETRDFGFKTSFSGVLGSLLLFSTSIYNRLIINLLPGRLISIEKAINLSMGSLYGSFVIVLCFLKADIVAAVVCMLIGAIGVVWSKKNRVVLFSRGLFGFGLVVWGLSLGEFASYSQVQNLSPWYGLLAGLALSILLRSSSVALIIGLWSLGEGSSVATFMYGAGVILGGAVPELVAGARGNVQSKQVSFLIFLQRLFAFGIGIGLALWLEGKEGSITKMDSLLFYGFILALSLMLCRTFRNPLLRLSKALYKDDEYPEEPRLETSHIGEETTASIALIQARRQVGKMANIVERVFVKVREYLNQERHPKFLAKIKDYERVTDNMKEEVENFLLVVMERPLTAMETKEVALLFRLVDELESIADYLDKIATYYTRLEESHKVSEEFKGEFFKHYDLVEKYFHEVMDSLASEEAVDISRLNQKASSLKEELEKLRMDNAQKLHSDGAKLEISMTYSDMVVALRKIRGHTRHISNVLGS